MLDTSHFDTYDSGSFRQFCGPSQVHKDLNTLYGLIVGIQADGHINDSEIEMLRAWTGSVSSLQDKAPYNKFVDKINAIISDGVVTMEEAEDLIWLCKNYLDYNRNPYYDVITSSTQQLGGFLAGISADKTINIEELTALGNWSSENAPLFKTWPFDTLLPAIERIQAERKLSADDHSELLTFCQSITSIKPAEQEKVTIPVKLAEQQVSILIQECSFCFTGESSRYSRKELAQIVEMYGGIAADSVTAKLHYLVICDVRNPAWAFEMYGRKVEKAMNMKKKGAGPEVVFEDDLFAALRSFGFAIN
ncbi:BRCT domain-containing protein [Dyadobacter sp.]|uniref:BRCT domain-containing protein n=1 Tax=Dyadobacter sp. TaxID=1914288 RepID=UPI003F6FD561